MIRGLLILVGVVGTAFCGVLWWLMKLADMMERT